MIVDRIIGASHPENELVNAIFILGPLSPLPDGVLDLAAGDPVEDNPLPRGAGVGDPGRYPR